MGNYKIDSFGDRKQNNKKYEFTRNVPVVTAEFQLVDGDNGDCLRYPSIPNYPVAVWVKLI